MNNKTVKKGLFPYIFIFGFIIVCLLLVNNFNNKVNELSERKEKAESKRNFATITSGLSTVAEIVTVLAALSNPSIGWTAIIAVIAKYFTNKNKIEACKEDDLLALRLNNLNLDLILTRAIAPQERAAGETQDERVEINGKAKQAAYSLEDEMLVDKYIESLVNTNSENKVKQYVPRKDSNTSNF